ncbi:MAG: helix-turn-helix domain-containing protein [Bacteroidota bacterium]
MDALNIRFMEVVSKMAVSKTAFAAELDISQGVLTHISTGRNKPGVELLQKILQAYPTIRAEWLLMGKGEMEKEVVADTTALKNTLQLAENRLQNALLDLKLVNELMTEVKEKLP